MDGLGIAGLEAIGGESGHRFAWEVVMAMAYVICPACFIAHQYDQQCTTPRMRGAPEHAQVPT
jgi:hypothetical protein